MTLLKQSVFVCLMLVALSLLSRSATASQAEPDQPHIVFFLIDDLGYSDCGFMGGTEIHTPRIDALAAQGVTLTSFYVQSVCSATRASILTGRYPTGHGLYGALKTHHDTGLATDERLLSNALQEAGYTTAICGKWHLGEGQPQYRPMSRGFDHQYGLWYGMMDYYTHRRGGRVDWYRDDQPIAEEGYATRLISDEACRLIQAQPSGRPLFLYVPFNAVHSPFQAPEESIAPYRDRLPEPRAVVAGMLAETDQAIGRIVDELDEAGMLDNTLFVFSSDNGGVGPGVRTSNAPLRSGKGTIYEGGVRVCAFITWPGRIPAGVTRDQPVHGIDLYPTLINVAGGSLDQAKPIDGRDLLPVLVDDAPSPHEAILLAGFRTGEHGVRAGDWKLLILPNNNGGERVELYNLAEDIGETRNLAEQHPEIIERLRGHLEGFLLDAKPNNDGPF